MRTIATYIYIVPFIWLGMILAISFMEAPLKFQAEGVSLPIGLQIGKLVFGVFNKVELVWLNILCIGCFFTKHMSFKLVIPLVVLGLLLAIDTFILLPELTERADRIIDHQGVKPSNVHLTYVIIEVLKLVLLFILGLKLSKIKLT